MLISEIVQSRIKADFLTAAEKTLLELKCKPFLEEIGYDVANNNLFRGSIPRGANTVIPGTRMFNGNGFIENRIPKAIPVSIHKRLNALFTEKFGIPFRNGVYATGDYDQATDYGTVHHFFPVGEFKYCWSPFQKDLFHYIDERDGRFTDEQLQKLVNTYHTTGLKEAIHDEVEIMFYCTSSILLPVQS